MSTNPRTDPDSTGNPTRLRWLTGTALVLALPVAFLWWPGCRQYPAVTSQESLRLMKLLYTATNTRDPVRLGRVETGVQKAAQDGKLTPAEGAAFQKVIAMARAGNWEGAERASFRFAQDQVGQGFPAEREAHTHPHDKAKRQVAQKR